MEEPCRMPPLGGPVDGHGWRTEVCRYRITARPKPKFKSTMDARELFGTEGNTEGVVTTRVAPDAYELDVRFTLSGARLHDTLTCRVDGGLIADRLVRRASTPSGVQTRLHEVHFGAPPYPLPRTSYPEVMLPFLMRAQPDDKVRRALYSWTNDGFCARVYYECRGKRQLVVPAGRFIVNEFWMYPDLNDWVSMGSVLTKLAKPLLPRYSMWFEVDAPHRAIRFEGPYGPPGAPEVIVELAA